MTLQEQLEKLEERLFLLEMQDHWTHEDSNLADKLQKSIDELRVKILASNK
jgi:hypothetical protein